MTSLPSRRRPLPILFAVLTVLPLLATAASTHAVVEDDGTETVVYLVRHAEKEPGDDPALTAEGRDRAAALAEILAGEGVDRILSSDTRRTRETAAPLAERLGLDVEIYDPHDLAELVTRLREASGETLLVVGHSNTTPEAVRLLGGDPVSPMPDDEYDRLYRVELPSGRTTLERFDAVSVPVE